MLLRHGLNTHPDKIYMDGKTDEGMIINDYRVQ